MSGTNQIGPACRSAIDGRAGREKAPWEPMRSSEKDLRSDSLNVRRHLENSWKRTFALSFNVCPMQIPFWSITNHRTTRRKRNRHLQNRIREWLTSLGLLRPEANNKARQARSTYRARR